MEKNKSTCKLLLNLSVTQKEDIVKYAKKREMNMSEYIRDVLKKRIYQEKRKERMYEK